MLDELEPCWVVVVGCCAALAVVGVVAIATAGCCGEPSVMGLPTVFHGGDPQGSSTVMVVEDVPPPGQVLTGMRHCGSSRLALVRNVVGRGDCSGVE